MAGVVLGIEVQEQLLVVGRTFVSVSKLPEDAVYVGLYYHLCVMGRLAMKFVGMEEVAVECQQNLLQRPDELFVDV